MCVNLQVTYNLSFTGGNRDYHSGNKIKEWRSSLSSNLAPLILSPRKDILLHHKYVGKLRWLDRSQDKADALREAFEHICSPNRKEVADNATESKSGNWFKSFFSSIIS